MKQYSKWLIFTLVAIAQFMVTLDVAITNVALPTIKAGLGFDAASLQWVVTAYVLCFGGFLLLGGRAADLFGRRRMLLIGMLAFTATSLLIGLAQTPLQLAGLRAVQGLAAALMSPAALSIVLVSFPGGLERNKALGYWTLVATGGAAIGMLLGGVLTQQFGWRWDFFINVPVGIVIAYLIRKVVPAHEQEEKRVSLDALGAVLVTASLMTQVFAFSQAPQWGWLDVRTLGSLAAAALLMAGFLFNEARAKHPLIPLSMLRIRNLVGANVIMAFLYAGMLGTFFLVTLYFQSILHFTPIQAGLSFLPFPIVLGFMSTRIPKLVMRYGYRRFLIAGPLLIATSFIWLALHSAVDGQYLAILPALVIMPLGIGLTMMPTIASATSEVEPQRAGVASGLISTSQQMGGALGLSILSGIAATVTASSLHLGERAAAVEGYHVAFWVVTGFMVVASLVATLVVRQRKPAPGAAQPRAATQAAAAGH